MALTTGSLAASATPATDFYALIATRLTAGGWTEEVTRTYTASIMGTTANCKVWTSPSTTVASSIYTGCIVSIEVDDTNSRIRIRMVEKFDSSLSGAAALNTKWAAPGVTATSSTTPTANYAVSDSFVAHFQATGAGQSVGWVEMACSASGFNYWLGVNANRMVFMNNSSGQYNVFYGGQLAYAGDLQTSAGNAAVFIIGNTLSSTTSNGSWTVASAGANAIARVSRDPNNIVSTTGAFTWSVEGAMWSGGQATATTNPAAYAGPGAGAHKYHQAAMVVFPAWLQPGGTGDGSNGALRGNFATLPEALVFMRPDATINVLNATSKALFPNLGETATASGVTYTCTGQIQTHSIISNSGFNGAAAALFFDGTQFS